MLTLPLKIEYWPRPGGQTVAWFVPGGDPAAWLEELAAAGLARKSTQLYILPGESSGGVQGLLVVPKTLEAVSRVSARWQSYGCFVGRMFLPTNAVLSPPIETSELARLLADDSVYVFHPTVGLVVFDRAQAIQVHNLLTAGNQSRSDWSHAQPGIGFNKRLIGVEPIRTLRLEQFLEAARDDIGSQPVDLESLPKSPQEPTAGIFSKFKTGWESILAAMAEQFYRFAPKTAARPTWVDAMNEWAGHIREKRYQQLDAIRNSEILRLLHLLESNPDEGLRYALPLTGDPHRGVAPASGRLGQRKVDYRGSQSGGAADVWDVKDQHRQKLFQRYRELASREIALGRHRRAAYILANLLGDFAAAASALEQGRHYREAAAIYRDRLRQPSEEARCLERGGLLVEAIAVYEQYRHWEKAGDLYRRIDQPDEANHAFERAVAERHISSDHLEAARLLEHKLNAVDRAADELWEAWPASRQASTCLRAYFELLGRQGKHELAQHQVGRLCTELLDTAQTVALVDELSHLATNYPNVAVQNVAADRTRVKTAEILATATVYRQRLTDAISRLVPGDRLLVRDCQRFATIARSDRRHVSSSPQSKSHSKCQLVHCFELPGVKWQSLISGGDTFLAAGYLKHQLLVMRGRWDGTISQAQRLAPFVRETERDLIWLEADRATMHTVFAHVPSNKAFDGVCEFPQTDAFPDKLTVRAHPALNAGTLAMSCCPGGPFCVLAFENGQLVLSHYQLDGTLTGTRDVAYDLNGYEGEDIPVSLLARNQRVYVAIANRLSVCGHAPYQFELPEVVRGLSASAMHSRPRIATVFDRGGAVLWDDYEVQRTEFFGRELESPKAAFTRDGWLVAAAREECQVYATKDRKLIFKASAPGCASNPIAVVATDYASQFAVCDDRGRVSVYSILAE